MTTHHKIIIFFSIIILFCNLIVKFYLIDIQINKINILQKQLVEERNRPLTQKKKEPDSEKYFFMKNDIDKVIEGLPHIFSLAEYVSRIGALIEKNQLSAGKGIVFKPEPPGRLGLRKCSTTLSLNGGYKGLKGLIVDLQNLPELLTLDRITFSRLSENRKKISLNLGISIYFRGDLDG